MVKWYSRSIDHTGATTTYSLFNLDTRNNTVSSPKIAQGWGHIKYIIATVGVDGAQVADTGNIFVLKLSGDAMYHGDQELIIGGLAEQETGTSVTDLVLAKAAFILPTNIWLKDGQVLDLSLAYYGTDTGTPTSTVSIGVERGRKGTPLQYRTRGDSHTSATDVFEALETKPDGSSGAFDVPRGVGQLRRMFALAIFNADADTLIGANNWTFEASGDAVGSTAQEITGFTTLANEGGGTVTSTTGLLQNPAVLPVEIPLIGGNSLSIQAAFKGTDLGTAFVASTLELVGGLGVQ